MYFCQGKGTNLKKVTYGIILAVSGSGKGNAMRKIKMSVVALWVERDRTRQSTEEF